MNVNYFLERINYHGSLIPNAENLKNLQIAHLLAVPFENLSIHAKEPIILEIESLYAKIVERRRGGFCYEANGLFAALLQALGFQVQMIAAEVARPDSSFGLHFDHMALLVSLQQRWLVDVGFGDSFIDPLLLEESIEQVQGRYTYKIVSSGEYLILMQREKDNDWKPQFRFTLQPYKFADYEEMCRYHQTSPESHFTRRRICSRATDDGGRITLSEMRFITTSSNGEKQERTLENQTEYDEILRNDFGIVMTKKVIP